jgi:hypothetical protein
MYVIRGTGSKGSLARDLSLGFFGGGGRALCEQPGGGQAGGRRGGGGRGGWAQPFLEPCALSVEGV